LRRYTTGSGYSWGNWEYIACRRVPAAERAAAALRQAAADADAGTVYAYATNAGHDAFCS